MMSLLHPTKWMHLWILLVATLCWLGFSSAVAQNPDKTPFSLSDLIDKEFQAKAEVFVNNNNKEPYTLFFDMYHDLSTMRGRLDLYRNGDVSSFYYSADIQEMVTISGTNCGVKNHNEGGFFSTPIEWGFLSNSSVIGPGSLFFRVEEKMVAQAEETIRGIQCEKFVANDPVDQNVQLSFWFTLENWKSPTKSQMRVPVRVSAQGQSTKYGLVNMTVDFTSFNADVANKHSFMIPRGIGCPGYKQDEGKTMPDILPQYSFALEVYDSVTRRESGKTEVIFYQVWYDYSGKAVKVTGTKDGKGFTEIQDFERGVIYHFNQDEVCSIVPLTKSNVEVAGSGILSAMKDPKQMLHLDKDYKYMGQEEERNILCDVWEAVQEDYVFGTIPLDKIVYTYYLSTNSTEFVSDGARDVRVPVALRVTLYPLMKSAKPIHLKMNFFRFDLLMGNTYFDQMNVRTCFSGETGRKLFAISFEDSEEKIASLKALHKATRITAQFSVKYFSKVSLLRLPVVNVYYEPTKILVQGEMLDLPPTISSFVDVRDDKLVPTTGELEVGQLRNADECAKKCFSNALPNCTAFTTCQTSDAVYVSCYLTAKTQRDNWSPPITGRSCTLYMKAISRSGSTMEPTLEEAMQTLKAASQKGEIVLSVVGANGEDLTVKSSGFDDSFQPSDAGSSPFKVVQKEKQLVSSESSQTSLELLTVLMSADECYQKCLEESRIACASFSYCSQSHKCILSSIYVSENNTSEVETATSCTVYRKDALQYFRAFPGLTPGLLGEVITAPTAEDCALSCRNNVQGFDCRGFDFCPDTKGCTLSKTHNIDPNQLKEGSPKCSYYSVMYSTEFGDLGRDLVKDSSALIRKSLDFESCAAECVMNQEVKCQSINFCVERLECQLSAKTSLDEGVETEEQEGCQHYIRMTSARTPDPDEKIFFPLKDVVSSDLQTHVDFFTNADSKIKLFAKEVHDIKNNRGRFEIVTSQKVSEYHYYSDPYQFVTIEGGATCTVSSDKQNNPFGDPAYWGWMDEQSKVVGPSAILFRETLKTAELDVKVMRRGIWCDVYEALDKLEPQITIKYYMTDNKWRSPTNTQMRVPIRVTAAGTLKNGKAVNSGWDFTYFQADVHQNSAVLIPRGIGCENLKMETKTPPSINPAYSFVSESFDLTLDLKGKVLISKVWYDWSKKVMKFVDIDNNDKPYTNIQDFNTGINYHLDEYDKCEIGPIETSRAEKSVSDLVNSIKNPMELLRLDGEYYYIGRVTVRGIECDAWEGIKKNLTLKGVLIKRAVFTYYFSQSKVETVAGGDANMNVPIAARMSFAVDTAKDAERYEINFFDFDEDTNRDLYSNINVETCFPDESQKNMFMLSMPVDEVMLSAAKQNTKMFELLTGWTIAEAASVSVLRIPFIKAYFEAERILVQGMMLERPPVLQGFHVPDATKFPPNVGEQELKGVGTKDECAIKCITNEKANCTGFTSCPVDGKTDKFDCYLTWKVDSSNWPQTIATAGCQFYSKSVVNEQLQDIPLDAAIAQLEDKVKKEEVKIVFLGQEDMVTFTPNDIQTGIKIGKATDSEKYSLAAKGKALPSGQEARTSLDVGGMVSSARECYSRCLKESSISCASFSFCSNKQECKLSSLYITQTSKDQTKDASSCDIYHREALMYFDEMKGQTSQATGAKTMTVTIPEECALACNEEKSFQCRGFDYCRKDKTCVLSKTHQLDLPALVSSTSCTHYSRKFSFDFDMMGRQLLLDPEFRIVKGSSLEECAKTCYDYDAFECLSFNFCPANGRLPATCEISKNVITDKTSVNVTNIGNCGYYQRIGNITRDVTRDKVDEEKEDKVQTKAGTNRVSSKAFNATLACLFFLGIVLGVGAFLGYSFYRKKKAGTDGVSIHYSRS